MIITKRNEFKKFALVTRGPKPHTDRSSVSWPLKPLATFHARANKRNKFAIKRMYAIAHKGLIEESVILNGLSSATKILLSLVDFLT